MINACGHQVEAPTLQRKEAHGNSDAGLQQPSQVLPEADIGPSARFMNLRIKGLIEENNMQIEMVKIGEKQRKKRKGGDLLCIPRASNAGL